jgi:hypothetical protein
MSLTSFGEPQPNLAWDFNGTTTDYMNSVGPTVTNGSPSFNSNGKFGKSIVFANIPGQGTNSLYYGTLPSNPTSYTISAWVKPLSLPYSGTNYGDQEWFTWDAGASSGTFRYWYVFTTYGSSSFSVTNNQRGAYNLTPSEWYQGNWGHITVVMQALSPTLVYFNGTLLSTISADTTNTFPLTTLSLAKTPAGSGTELGANCEIDDFRIYNTALNAAQIQRIYMANGIPSRMAQTGSINSNTLPTFSGYTYIPLRALPTSFTLTQTSTGNAWTYNQASNQIRDGNWGGDAAMTLTASQPNTMYYERQPGIWYRLLGNNINYVRHGGFIMFLQGFADNNFDYAWAFFLKNGTTNQVIIWNAFGTVANGSWVQSGTQTSGRIAVKEVTLEQAHVYTLSVPVSPYSFTPISMYNSPFTFTFTFTNMGATGSDGPTSITYPVYPNGVFSLVNGIQYWTVPTTKIYNFTIAGAGNYNPNSLNTVKIGTGIVLTASRLLTAGTVIAILVGQMGRVGTSDNRATGGSGGTFVATVTAQGSLAGATPLFISGGSGGVGYQTSGSTNINGTITNNGLAGIGGAGGAGGTAPNGGAGGNAGDGGGGYSGNGGQYTFIGGSSALTGRSFTSGGKGGTNNYYAAAYGGFGGGSAGGALVSSTQYPAGGGGGGYGGGGGGGSSAQGGNGGGAGSYDITGVYSGSSTNTGMGYVTITTV